MHRKRATRRSDLLDELVIDNFAGGGGASLGIERALGRAVDFAINHDREAVALHRANHPHTVHYCEDVWSVDPAEVTRGRKVGLAWFSPDCKHFSKAKGGKPVEKKIRGLAWVVVRWAAKVKPRIILLENVREFETWGPLDSTNKPCPRRKGMTFRRWVSTLRNLGYAVEWRMLDAADFGAPTHRKRLFLVARCDGEPIRWPEPTHGPKGGKPYRTAAECIDWSLPCPSIFLTKQEGKRLGVIRPLAEKTMRRIAMGVRKYVIENPRPFIVRCNHGGDEFRGQEATRPLGTVTGRHGYGVVAPFLIAQYGEAPHQDTRGQLADEPIRTITPRQGGGFPLIQCQLEGGRFRGQSAAGPLGTITAVARPGLIAPTLIQYNQEKGNEARGVDVAGPLNTVVSENRFGLVSAFLAKHYGGVIGHGVDRGIGTVTAVDHHSLVACHLTKFYGTNVGSEADKPAPTVTGEGKHLGAVTAFLTKYYGTNVGLPADGPLHTVTSLDRFGLVVVDGLEYRIADIGLRMLQPRELYRAQGFPDEYRIDISYGAGRLSKSAQVRMCGNSVCPQVAEALVRANCSDLILDRRKPKRRAAAAGR